MVRKWGYENFSIPFSYLYLLTSQVPQDGALRDSIYNFSLYERGFFPCEYPNGKMIVFCHSKMALPILFDWEPVPPFHGSSIGVLPLRLRGEPRSYLLSPLHGSASFHFCRGNGIAFEP